MWLESLNPFGGHGRLRGMRKRWYVVPAGAVPALVGGVIWLSGGSDPARTDSLGQSFPTASEEPSPTAAPTGPTTQAPSPSLRSEPSFADPTFVDFSWGMGALGDGPEVDDAGLPTGCWERWVTLPTSKGLPVCRYAGAVSEVAAPVSAVTAKYVGEQHPVAHFDWSEGPLGPTPTQGRVVGYLMTVWAKNDQYGWAVEELLAFHRTGPRGDISREFTGAGGNGYPPPYFPGEDPPSAYEACVQAINAGGLSAGTCTPIAVPDLPLSEPTPTASPWPSPSPSPTVEPEPSVTPTP
jgi:hypothetical protein